VISFLGEEQLFSRPFNSTETPSAHRRRTDLIPAIIMTPANRVAMRVDNGSRSSTPGQKMLRSKTTGRGQSMPRLDHLIRSRVLVKPHETPTRNRLHNHVNVTSGPKVDPTTKSVSMVQLCHTISSQERKVVRNTKGATGPTGKIQPFKTSTFGDSSQNHCFGVG